MSVVDIATVAGAVIALLALGWAIWTWLQSRKDTAKQEDLRRADNVVVYVEPGEPLDDGLPTWDVKVANRGDQPIRDLSVTYSIRACTSLPSQPGQVGSRIAFGPWQGPHNLYWPLIAPREEVEQTVFWEGPVDPIDGPTILGAKFRDHRGITWIRQGDDAWRPVKAKEFDAFQPTSPVDG